MVDHFPVIILNVCAVFVYILVPFILKRFVLVPYLTLNASHTLCMLDKSKFKKIYLCVKISGSCGSEYEDYSFLLYSTL